MEKLFDYLYFKDIYNFGQTCVRMERAAGHYYRTHLSKNRIWVNDDGFCGFRKYAKYFVYAHYSFEYDYNNVYKNIDWNAFEAAESLNLCLIGLKIEIFVGQTDSTIHSVLLR